MVHFPSLALSALLSCPAAAADTATFAAHDSLEITTDQAPEVQDMLDQLQWQPRPFEVTCATTTDREYDASVSFPSARPTGQRQQDTVQLMWYAARDKQGQAVEAPAVIVVHSLHPAMPVAQIVARGLRQRKIHVFAVQMPGFAARRPPHNPRHSGVIALLHGRQAVADVRRSRDAVAALPNVRAGPIALVGISLGGFVASVAASMDNAFEPVCLVLTGADGYRALQEGWHDAQRLKGMLQDAGYENERLKALIQPVEPSRLAHRLDSRKVWLFSATADRVIPAFSSDLLARTIDLDDQHHLHVAGNHYTAVIALPWIVPTIAEKIALSHER